MSQLNITQLKKRFHLQLICLKIGDVLVRKIPTLGEINPCGANSRNSSPWQIRLGKLLEFLLLLPHLLRLFHDLGGDLGYFPHGLKKHRAPGKSGNGKWWMNPSNNPPETKLSSSNPKHLEPWRLFIYRMDPTGASHFQIHSEPYPSKQMFPKLLLLSLHFFSQSSGTKIFDQPLSVYLETSTTMGPWVKITDRVRTLGVLWGFVSLSLIFFSSWYPEWSSISRWDFPL